jgi:predicted dehydrogenase
MAFKLGVIGIDHGHIFGMLGQMKAQGCTCDAYWTDGPAVTEAKFNETFPEVAKVTDRRRILDDPAILMILISAVPADRAALAIEAMEAGKDVMVDKPGCTTLEQLAAIRECQARTGRIWSVNFSERFEVPAVTKAEELVFGGAIGRVVQTVGLGPHKQNLKTRPQWYFERDRFGGILTDIGSHQIDQFLHFTGSETAEIMHAHVENTTMPDHPGFQDFGEMVLKSPQGHGYVRVDWFTPAGCPPGATGGFSSREPRATSSCASTPSIGRPHVTNTLYLVNATENAMIDCNDAGLPYFPRLVADVEDRTETAAGQGHTFTVMDLAIRAQMKAEGA